jgi:hypothetical protein
VERARLIKTYEEISMKQLTIACLFSVAIAAAAASAADPTLRVFAVPHDASDAAIRPAFLPGVAGVGVFVAGESLPCMNCYGAPSGSLVLPPPATIIAPYKQVGEIFYFAVDVGDVSEPATVSLQVTEASTGKPVLTSSVSDVTVTPNATNVFGWSTILTDTDGYEGLEKVVYTASSGTLTATCVAYIWVLHHRPNGN